MCPIFVLFHPLRDGIYCMLDHVSRKPSAKQKSSQFMSSLTRFTFYIGPFFTCCTDRRLSFRIVYPKHRKLASLLIYRCRAFAAPAQKPTPFQLITHPLRSKVLAHTCIINSFSCFKRAIACSEVSSSIPLRAKYCKISFLSEVLRPNTKEPLHKHDVCCLPPQFVSLHLHGFPCP